MRPLPSNVLSEINALYALTTEELQARYFDLFGKRIQVRAKAFLLRLIIHRLQENVYGGLSISKKASLKREAELAKLKPEPRTLQPGTRLLKEYAGKQHAVLVRDERQFEYDGCLYRSLSAIAKKITGTHWNGKRFFGITK